MLTFVKLPVPKSIANKSLDLRTRTGGRSKTRRRGPNKKISDRARRPEMERRTANTGCECCQYHYRWFWGFQCHAGAVHDWNKGCVVGGFAKLSGCWKAQGCVGIVRGCVNILHQLCHRYAARVVKAQGLGQHSGGDNECIVAASLNSDDVGL